MSPLRRFIGFLDCPSRLGNLVFLAVAAVLMLALVGYLKVDIRQPIQMTGDHLFLLTQAKSYINGHGFRFDSQLGFPGERDNLYFPSFDLSYRILVWVLARIIQNPFLIVHIFYMTGLSAMACAGYWTLRRLGIAAWLSLIGVLCAFLTPYLQGRSFAHDTLALSVSVPFGLGLALMLGSDRHGGRLSAFLKDPFIVVAIVVVGTSGLYYAFYTVMLSLFVGVAAALGERRLFPLLAAMTVAVSVFVLLVFSGYGLDLPDVLSGRFAQPRRQAFEQLLYGLEFTTASYQVQFIPKVASAVGQARIATPLDFQGEAGFWPGLTLTATILASPMFLAAGQFALNSVKGPALPKLRLMLITAAALCFTLLFAARGGIGFLFNLLVTPEIRADARVMPFLTFGAVIMLCTLGEIARTADKVWMRVTGPALAALLLIAAAPKYLDGAFKWQSSFLNFPEVKALRQTMPQLIAAKDKAQMTAVLELPVVEWPEAPSPEGFNPYSFQLPYIYDGAHSHTHWSYGASGRQRAFGIISMMATRNDGLVDRARHLGFDGVLVAKQAYPQDKLSILQADLAQQLGTECRVYDDEIMSLYSLKRSGRQGC